ncbi:MAG: rod shape-determining protein [Clostridia bacterium]|nr:rod shape-determining protein [Clostridia bacterium]
MAQFNLAIDLGTINTVIYVAGLGVALKEPSCIAIETINNKRVVKCVGSEAKKLIGKTNNSIEVVFPIVEGVIHNFQLAKLMLKEFLKKVAPTGIGKPRRRVVFMHACGLTKEEKNRIRDLAYALNITATALIPSSVCALIGMEVEENDPNSHFVVNIGGGVTDIAIINNNHIIRGATINVGGLQIDANICSYVKEKYQIVLGVNTLETVKNSIGSLLNNDISAINVVGLEIDTQRRKEIRLYSQEILPIIAGAFNKIAEACEALLNMCSSEVLSDINIYGIYVCGGVANITGVDKYMSKLLNLPVYTDVDPDSSVILGAGNLLNNQTLLNTICKEMK